MESSSLEQKLAQFHEFFTIKHKLNVNMNCLGKDFVLPSTERLVDNMPYAFKIASEISGLDTQSLRPLRNLGEHAKDLANFLNLQAKKIDLMMSFILQQQDQPTNRYQSIEFGGGGVSLVSQEPIEIGEHAELKLFLTEEAAGVFCYGEVIQCEAVDDNYHIALIFTRIREEDQELLVRASLHIQTLQLRARSKLHNNEPT